MDYCPSPVYGHPMTTTPLPPDEARDAALNALDMYARSLGIMGADDDLLNSALDAAESVLDPA